MYNSSVNNPKIMALAEPLKAYLQIQFQVNTINRKLDSDLTDEEREVLLTKLESLNGRNVKNLDTLQTLINGMPEYTNTDIHVTYGGKFMRLHQVPIAIPSAVRLAYYFINGFDAERLLSDLNMEVLSYYNLRLNKIEVGEKYHIPWHLVDQHKDNFELYTRIVTAYTNYFGSEFNLYNREHKTIPVVREKLTTEQIFDRRRAEAQRTLTEHRKAVNSAELEVQAYIRRTSTPKLRGVAKARQQTL